MTIVIQAESLGKRYTLRHENSARYDTLSEKLANIGATLRNKKHQRKSSEEFWAIKDANFSVQQGDRVGIIGKNGAGKSTILKLLSRITEPTTGKIGIKGRIASLLEVGTGFHPELTGRENIYLNGAILGMSRRDIQHKFNEIVSFSEVDRFLDTPVKRYSSGMYVRLAFAIAAHLEPEILIVDEVLAVGDSQFQKKCLAKMKSVGDEGRTVLFVSHNQSAISSLCTSALLLDQGSIAFSGTVNETIENYNRLSRENAGSYEAKSTNDLSKRRIKSIRQRDEKSSIALFDDLVFHLQLSDGGSYKGCRVGLIIKNRLDEWMFSTATQMVGLELATLDPATSEIQITIPQVNLMPDEYTVDVSLIGEDNNRLEYLENALSFTVLNRDIWNSGFLITPHFGKVVVDAKWEFVKNA